MDEPREVMVNRTLPPSAASRRTLLGLIALYLAIAGYEASTKLLWGDELITLAIARQGSFAAIWHSLTLGTDPNPPLTHWLVLLSTNALGAGALAVSLPSVLCVLLAIVSLWTILRRWVTPSYAAAGVLAFMATRGFDYAYDARSYAPLIGFAMASLALWLVSTDTAGWKRATALAGMAAALACGLSSNYYGVLAFFPIAIGEALRETRVKRFSLGPWIAMAVAALPLLAYLPLIHHNIAEFTPHAWNRTQPRMILDSYIEIVEGVFWPVLGLALYAGWMRWRRGSVARGDAQIPTYELAAIVTLVLYPFLGFFIALGGAGMISPRCVVPVCCGFGIAAALLGRRVFGSSRRASVWMLAAMLAWVVARETACGIVLHGQRMAFLAVRDQVAAVSATDPIVVGDSLIVLPLEYYSRETVGHRIVFPVDFEAIHRIEPDDSGEQNLWAGRNGVFPVQIVPYSKTALDGAPLILIARPHGWLALSLAGDGFQLGAPLASPTWGDLGGIFTPLAHEDTRIFLVQSPR